jgi:NAD(P)-dependent dehydrogenase (short-subunit alcohol dehydrogenase family)
VTDIRARQPLAYWAPYAASKAAAETLVLSWAAEVATTPLRVNLFDPGPMRTRLRSIAFPGEDPTSLPPPGDAAAALARLCFPAETRHGELISI